MGQPAGSTQTHNNVLIALQTRDTKIGQGIALLRSEQS